MSYSRALLSLELSGRVQSQSFLHTLAILDLGDLFLLLSLYCFALVPSCLLLYSLQSPSQMSGEERSGGGWRLVAGGWRLGSNNGSWLQQTKFNNLDGTGQFLEALSAQSSRNRSEISEKFKNIFLKLNLRFKLPQRQGFLEPCKS